MFFDFIDIIFNSKEYKDLGSAGEQYTYRDLIKVFGKKNILRNVYVKMANDEYTEIDLIAVSSYGMFVFESKNYSGWIFGNEQEKKWTQILNRNDKFLFYNPIWQNNTHIKALRLFLNQYNKAPYFSFVVFSERCSLKSITFTSNNTFVINRQDLTFKLRNTLRSRNEVLSEYDVNNIINILSPFSRPDNKIKEKHIEDLRNRLSIK